MRCSGSLPMIVPPVVMNGELHMDGGLLNNLPVDVMRRWIGENHTIIAARLSSNDIDKHKYSFPPVLSFVDLLLFKLKWKKTDYVMPSFLETFLNVILVGSSYKENQNSIAADILVYPDLTHYTSLRYGKNNESLLIKYGYEETIVHLNRHALKLGESSHLF